MANSKTQIESLTTSIDQLQEENTKYENEIDSLKEAIDAKSDEIQNWEKKYTELDGKYAEVQHKNSVHSKETSQQIEFHAPAKNIESGTESSLRYKQHSAIIAVSIVIVLAILGYPIGRYAYSINKGVTNARLRTSIMKAAIMKESIIKALSPPKGRKRTQSFKDTPDPLSNVIVMDDTPTTSPKSHGFPSLKLPAIGIDSNSIILEEEDVKISEIDIPDTCNIR